MDELVSMIPPRGGSDILEQGLRKRIDFDSLGVNLIVSRCQENLIDNNKKNIIWQHLNYNEPLTQGMLDKFFVRLLDASVYVSHWQYEKFRYVYSVPTENVYIIKNAIEPIHFMPREKSDKIKLIYTSTPFRGLELLLDVFEILNRDDVELNIYSSTIIYGTDYDNKYKEQYSSLFNRAASMKNVNYHGYATNAEVIKALQSTHIYVYPSLFEETCCLSMIEAGAAGCSIISHNLGAIYETAAEFGTLLPIRIDQKQMANLFAEAINYEIDVYWKKQDLLKYQSDYFNNFYSWNRIEKQWHKLLSEIS